MGHQVPAAAGAWASHLNTIYQQGYRLHVAFEQRGNTVMVFEHRHPPF
ncbi:MAG: hypothetical protein ACRDT6_17445 [Micromonosporaceae bacterium]